jgi:hypothetical protein
MQIIAIADQKGSCGKDTTAVNLAEEPGRQGRRTLLIDMNHASLGLGIGARGLPGAHAACTDDMLLDGMQRLQGIIDLSQDTCQLEIPLKALLTMFDTHPCFSLTVLQRSRTAAGTAARRTDVQYGAGRRGACLGELLNDCTPHSTVADGYRRLAVEVLTASEKPGVSPIQADTRLPQQREP